MDRLQGLRDFRNRRLQLLQHQQNSINRPIREYNDPLRFYDGQQFKRRFRFSKEAVRDVLLPLVQDQISFSSLRNEGVSPMEQLLVFLRFLATDSFHIVSGDLSTCTTRHESSISRYIHRVARAFAQHSSEFFKMPQLSEASTIQRQFYERAGFPGVIGIIDGVQIPISNPGGPNSELYRNRKNIFALNCQVICDAELNIRDIVCRWFGSAHDARIFDNSAVRHRFDSGEFQGVLLGDAGYALKPYLMVPVARPHTDAEERYNQAHKSTGITIERLFGVFKRKFPVFSRGLRFSPRRSATVIVSGAICFNIHRKLGETVEDSDYDDFPDEGPDDELSGTGSNERPGVRAVAVRNEIIFNHFT